MKWFRDVVLIPVLITIVGGFLFMLWGAWYSGVKWHSPFSAYWLKAVLSAPVQLWFVLLLVMVALMLPPWLAARKRDNPKLGVFWHSGECLWYVDPLDSDSVCIKIEGMLTATNSRQTLHIVRAYIKGVPAMNSLPEILLLDPDSPVTETFGLRLKPKPSIERLPMIETIIFVDRYNREYVTPPVTIRPATDDEIFQLVRRQVYG